MPSINSFSVKQQKLQYDNRCREAPHIFYWRGENSQELFFKLYGENLIHSATENIR
jgi:hypothetical protein